MPGNDFFQFFLGLEGLHRGSRGGRVDGGEDFRACFMDDGFRIVTDNPVIFSLLDQDMGTVNDIGFTDNHRMFAISIISTIQ